VDYSIDVTLNDSDKTLDAFEKINYINNSPDTLTFIWFHLWPNAYKTDRTAFSDQMLQLGDTRFYFSSKEQKGYINHLDFKVDGLRAKTEDHPTYIDVIKLILPKTLYPGGSITITTPFHVKLPFNFSRGGFDKKTFQVTQWYPKPAVYDRKGWHPMPYLHQGEFYSEFGSYSVHITLPQAYIVAATGALKNPNEIKITKSLTGHPSPLTNTYFFQQDSIHDFAWFANKNFILATDTCNIQGKIITVQSYYLAHDKKIWQNSLEYAKDGLRYYSQNIGPYPYPVATVVEGPQSFGGGMEYPTITVISPMSDNTELERIIVHELGHNWFYGMLASNERDHPWMDEGMNTFYEERYLRSKYGPQQLIDEIGFQTLAKQKIDQAIETTSEQFSEWNYNLVPYHKTSRWMNYLEMKMGKERFKQMMQDYFTAWAFHHPYPEDFEKFISLPAAEKDSVFMLLTKTGLIPKEKLTGFDLLLPSANSISNYLIHPVKNSLLIAPSFGANQYDKVLIGGIITNIKLPPTSLQYLLIPMYGTGSHKFNGLGKINYSLWGNSIKTDFFLNASMFSQDNVIDTGVNKIAQFKKLVPGFRISIKEKNPLSTNYKYIQWKTFLINDQYLQSVLDTVFNGPATIRNVHFFVSSEKRYLNQLQFVIGNYRALYPFEFKLQAEQAQGFIRTTFTANYYFNYSATDGLQVRWFVGKFNYLGEKSTFKQYNNDDRYFLNMTGPNGYEDYTYTDYFIGRNSFDGVTSQQIMIRDGGFKVRTDLLYTKIAKTDKWLTALNFNSSIPDKLNPLSALPIKIPLHLFLDVGTYAEAWDETSGNNKFLFDFGIHLPLFRQTINVYIPLLYSKVYKDYFQQSLGSNRFLKEISFSIDLYNKDLKKIERFTGF
jgi:Aminopeptidase N